MIMYVLMCCTGRKSAGAAMARSAAASSGTQTTNAGMVISNIMSLAPGQKSTCVWKWKIFYILTSYRFNAVVFLLTGRHPTCKNLHVVNFQIGTGPNVKQITESFVG